MKPNKLEAAVARAFSQGAATAEWADVEQLAAGALDDAAYPGTIAGLLAAPHGPAAVAYRAALDAHYASIAGCFRVSLDDETPWAQWFGELREELGEAIQIGSDALAAALASTAQVIALSDPDAVPDPERLRTVSVTDSGVASIFVDNPSGVPAWFLAFGPDVSGLKVNLISGPVAIESRGRRTIQVVVGRAAHIHTMLVTRDPTGLDAADVAEPATLRQLAPVSAQVLTITD